MLLPWRVIVESFKGWHQAASTPRQTSPGTTTASTTRGYGDQNDGAKMWEFHHFMTWSRGLFADIDVRNSGYIFWDFGGRVLQPSIRRRNNDIQQSHWIPWNLHEFMLILQLVYTTAAHLGKPSGWRPWRLGGRLPRLPINTLRVWMIYIMVWSFWRWESFAYVSKVMLTDFF